MSRHTDHTADAVGQPTGLAAALDILGRHVTSRPRTSLLGIFVLTLVFGFYAGQQETGNQTGFFAPESQMSRDLDAIAETFGASLSEDLLQVVIDAGPGGNIVSSDGVTAAAELADAIRSDPVAGPGLLDDPLAIVSYADATLAAGEGAGSDDLGAALGELLEDPVLGPQVAGLLSEDLDPATGRARAGIVVVRFDPDQATENLRDAVVAAADRTDALGLEERYDVTVDPFNQQVVMERTSENGIEELQKLMGLSLVLLTGILVFAYRRITDIVIGLVAVVITIVWTQGAGVLLGPDYLGVMGIPTSMAVVVPIILVGLGIDYGLQLTYRYREDRGENADPAPALRRTLSTVGAALALTTATTMVGFLTNASNPLPPIRDFGIQAAVGVVLALVVFTVLVPAARLLIDRRIGTKSPITHGEGHGVLSRVSHLLARGSEKWPAFTISVASLLALAGLASAFAIPTVFSQLDFIPADSREADLLERLDTLFGGDVSERTYAYIEGDLTTPEALTAVAETGVALSAADGVRPGGTGVSVTSIATVLDVVAVEDPQRAATLGWTAEGAAPGSDGAALVDWARSSQPDLVTQVLSSDGGTGVLVVLTTGGEEGARTLGESLDPLLAPLRTDGGEARLASTNLLTDETNKALARSGGRGVVLALGAGTLLVVGYFFIHDRRPWLGASAMVCTAFVVCWSLGVMFLLGMSFTVMTVMFASIAVGISVDYSIHMTHRFIEEYEVHGEVSRAIHQAADGTGAALLASAATTAAGFGALALSTLPATRQFGAVIALTIVFAYLSALLVLPAMLTLWARRRGDRVRPTSDDVGSASTPSAAVIPEVVAAREV